MHRRTLEIRDLPWAIHPRLELNQETDIATNLTGFARLLDRQLRRTPHLWHRWNKKECFDWALERASEDLRTRHVGAAYHPIEED